MKIYAGIVYILSLPVFLALQQTKGLPIQSQLILAVPVVVGLAAAGGLMMRKRWAFVLEFIRVPLFIFIVYAVTSVLRREIMLGAVAGIAAIGIIQLFWLVREFRRDTQLQTAA